MNLIKKKVLFLLREKSEKRLIFFLLRNSILRRKIVLRGHTFCPSFQHSGTFFFRKSNFSISRGQYGLKSVNFEKNYKRSGKLWLLRSNSQYKFIFQ